MSVENRFFSLTEPPPRGFSVCHDFSRRAFRSAPFALVAPDFTQAEFFLGDAAPKLAGVVAAVSRLGPLPDGFKPAAAIVISCAGRKWLLDDSGTKELETFFGAVGEKLPLVGFPSFGEIAPFRRPEGSYTPTCFHNVTFVVCLLGG